MQSVAVKLEPESESPAEFMETLETQCVKFMHREGPYIWPAIRAYL